MLILRKIIAEQQLMSNLNYSRDSAIKYVNIATVVSSSLSLRIHFQQVSPISQMFQ